MPAGDRFCQSCGSPVAATCPRCGADLAPDAAFCASCGARATGSAASPIAAVAGPPPAPGLAYASMPPPTGMAPPQLPPVQFAPPPRNGIGPAPFPPPAFAMGALTFRYCGVVRRFFAALVDGLIFMVASWLIAGSAGGTTADGFDLNGTPALLLSLVYLGYFVVLEGALGATIGKLVLGMKVVNKAGQAPGLGAALVRNLLRIVDALPLFYVVGMIAIAGSKTRQRVGDRAARTFVVRR